MYRRVVSLLLVPCALLTQSAALSHAHCGHATGHDPRPHLHVKPAATGHGHHHNGHRHHHGPGGHHHPHETGDDDPAAQPSLAPAAPADHDSDALYLTATDLASGRLSGFDPAVADCLGLHDPSVELVVADVSPARPAWAHPPPIVPRCPLYVRHLALLI